MATLYNRSGTPFAYSDDGTHIFSFSGDPLGYLYEGKIYSYRGKHLGWFSDGWIRDLRGCCVFYLDGAHGGPVKPTMKVNPVKSVKRIIPIKSTREVAHVRPVSSYSWSIYSGYDFFNQ